MNAEDSRRIAFHIRFNRASSLFARCWLLVEGETETWVINEPGPPVRPPLRCRRD